MRSLFVLALSLTLSTTGCTKRAGLIGGGVTAGAGGLVLVGGVGGSCAGGIPGEYNGGCGMDAVGAAMVGSTLLLVGGVILGINALRSSPEPRPAPARPLAMR